MQDVCATLAAPWKNHNPEETYFPSNFRFRQSRAAHMPEKPAGTGPRQVTGLIRIRKIYFTLVDFLSRLLHIAAPGRQVSRFADRR
jgi:hypothetical protein